MNIKELKSGMMVYHESWVASEPMLVVKKNNKLMLRSLEGEEDTDILDGGEDENGWEEVEK